jgi:phospho-N-acetylmuramoyl-pentapeptide-transferase
LLLEFVGLCLRWGTQSRVILMLIFFYKFLISLGFKVPLVFFYSSTRMILAAMTTLLITIFFGPRCIKFLYEMKTGQSIRVENCPVLAELHQKKKDTPSMGGILILSSMLVAMLLWMDLENSFTVILGVSTIWLGLLGGYDDYLKMKKKNSKGLSAKKKFGLQILLSALVAFYLLCPWANESMQSGWRFLPPIAKEQVRTVVDHQPVQESQILSTQEYASRYYLPFYKDPIFILKGAGLTLGVLLTIFVITGSSNAVNLTDGLDGLAAGCVIMSAIVLAAIAFLSNHVGMARYLNILYIEGSGEIAVYLAAMIGACLGFLWYNGSPAQIFMGDTGSLALGGILGISAVLLRREFLFAIVGGIFVMEALSVILQVTSFKLRNKKRIFLCSPLHHHFEYKGWPETKVVIRFWIIAFILAMIGLASLKFQ